MCLLGPTENKSVQAQKSGATPLALPVSLMHKNAVEGHDLLSARFAMVDPRSCICRPGDNAVHVSRHVPGDNPGSSIITNNSKVANLEPK